MSHVGPSKGRDRKVSERTRKPFEHSLSFASRWKQGENVERYGWVSTYETCRWTARKKGRFSTMSKSSRFCPFVKAGKARSYVKSARAMKSAARLCSIAAISYSVNNENKLAHLLDGNKPPKAEGVCRHGKGSFLRGGKGHRGLFESTVSIVTLYKFITNTPPLRTI